MADGYRQIHSDSSDTDLCVWRYARRKINLYSCFIGCNNNTYVGSLVRQG